MRDLMKIRLISLIFMLSACSQSSSKKTDDTNTSSNDKVKEELLLLERKWLDAEFKLDTSYISTLMDPNFIDISADHIHNKQQALRGMYNNCLLYTSPSPRDRQKSRMPSSA